MKYLLLGIDGAQNEIFQRYDMPFVHSLIKKGKDLNLTADLISRGWVEIYTGQQATETGGYYEKPIANGTLEWSKDFKLSSIPGYGADIKPLWQVINELGFKVGVMNVPTTNPAPQVDGFFVSGGGGGKNISEGIAVEQCYPKEIKNSLDESGYIVDERVPSLLWEKGLFDAEKFIDRLILMTEKRIESYILLCKQYQVDFGFLVLRSVAVIEYLANGEGNRYLKQEKNTNEKLVLQIFRFYSRLDQLIEKLFKSLSPEQAMLVSDHGLVPRLFGVNLNAFLIKNGFQQSSGNKSMLFQFVKSFRHFIPYSLRQALKKNKKIKSGYQSLVNFDKEKSLAFNITQMGAIFGIYLNDKERFGGPVKVNEKEALKNTIINCFNEDVECQKHVVIAIPFEGFGKPFDHLMPDILVSMPDGYMPVNESKQLFSKHAPSFNEIDLTKVRDDNWTGIKGTKALSIDCFQLDDAEQPSMQNNTPGLTTVFTKVVASFKRLQR